MKKIILLSKRKRFIISSVLLSLGFVGVQLVGDSYRFISIGLLSLLTILFTVWSIWEGLGFNMTLLTLVLPTFFTMGVGLFWFLLPVNIFARIPIVVFYGFGIYALCLTANIYTVSAIRTIALLRAARGVGFVLTLVTSFLLFDTVLSLRTPILATGTMIIAVTIPLFFQGFWIIPLEREFDRKVFTFTVTSAVLMGEVAVALFFWPVTVVVGSLFLTVTMYMLLGLGQAQLEARMFSTTVREYLMVGILVFIGMFIATRWGA